MTVLMMVQVKVAVPDKPRLSVTVIVTVEHPVRGRRAGNGTGTRVDGEPGRQEGAV